MNLRKEQDIDPRVQERLDGALREFFQAEMPQPWPSMTPPVVARLPHRTNRARWALAASIALLVAGTWFVIGRTPPEVSGPGRGVELGNREKPWMKAPADKPTAFKPVDR
jgi:hypothetical protein